MANPKYTRKAAQTIVLMRLGAGNYAANDDHLTIGKGDSGRIGRAEFRVPEPDWPAHGKLVRATLTIKKSGTSAHDDFKGSSPQVSIRRMDHKAGFSVPNTADGFYTQQGSGDKYPGGSTAGSDIVFNVTAGTTNKDISGLIEAMLPTSIKKRGGAPGGNDLYGYFQLRSSDENSSSRSSVLSTDISITVEIKTAVTPDAPTILEIAGAQDDDDPTTVGSADGQTVDVRFAFVTDGVGDVASKAELAFLGVGATDAADTPLIKTTGSVTPRPAGAAGQYWIKLTGLPIGSEGRIRVRATSQKGEQGDWSTLEDDSSHIQLATIPGPPLDIVVQPFTDDTQVLFSLNSPDPADVLMGAQAIATLLPQGTLAKDTGPQDIGGSTRRGSLDIDNQGSDFSDGQRVSVKVRTQNAAGVWGSYSAPVEQTMRERRGPVVTPDPGRVLSKRPTFVITDALFDGWRLRLLDHDDNSRVLYDSGGTTVVNQTAVSVTIPAGILTYGQTFDVVASTLPDGGGAVYGVESYPQTYTVAALPVTVLSVPESFNRRVDTTDPEWLRTVTDPDGAAIAAIDQEIRVASTPQGGGTLVARYYDPTATALRAIPSGTFAFETAVDSRARATNDISSLWATTLNGALSVGATSATLVSAASAVVGQDIVIASGTSGNTEVREIATTPGANVVTWIEPLDHTHASGQAVTARAFGAWSNWLTSSALEPPDVTLITPADGSTVTRPWQTLSASVAANGTRSIASSVVTLYTSAGDRLATLDDAVVVGAALSVDIPAYLLDDATDYAWDVTVTDSLGMETQSAQWTFVTAFTEPDGVASVTAEADPDSGAVVVSWDPATDADLHHYAVEWQADDGSWLRIDDGPESLLDGNTPMTGTSLLHIGARLGDNAYRVGVDNGWRSSETVTADVTLDQPSSNRGSWQAVADGVFVQLRTLDTPRTTEGTIERMQAPGGQPREIQWGLAARHVSMTVDVAPAVDGLLSTTLRGLMADIRRARAATPVWLKAPAGWYWDPMWMTLQSFSDAPGVGGRMRVSLDWAELGDPVYAIIPSAPEPEELPEPDAFVDTDTYDFGEVVIS